MRSELPLPAVIVSLPPRPRNDSPPSLLPVMVSAKDEPFTELTPETKVSVPTEALPTAVPAPFVVRVTVTPLVALV